MIGQVAKKMKDDRTTKKVMFLFRFVVSWTLGVGIRSRNVVSRGCTFTPSFHALMLLLSRLEVSPLL